MNEVAKHNKHTFDTQLEKCIGLSDRLKTELRELQHYADCGHYTPDQSRVLDFSIDTFCNAMGIIEKLDQIKMNEDRH